MKKLPFLILLIFLAGCVSTNRLYLTHTGFYGLKKGASIQEFREGWIKPNAGYTGAYPAWERSVKEGDDLWELLVFDVYDPPSVLSGNPVINHQEYVLFRNGLLEKWGDGSAPELKGAESLKQGAFAREYLDKALGTAWSTPFGYAATSLHVVDRKKNIVLITLDGRKIPVTIVAEDRESDVALLAPTGPELLPPPLTIAKSAPRLGMEIFTIGFPLPSITGFSPKLVAGRINSTKGLMDNPRTMQISAPIMQGNSGGPLFNMDGEVIGITAARLRSIKFFNWHGDIPQNVNYAVKIEYLTALIVKKGKGKGKSAEPVRLNSSGLEEMAEKLKSSVLLVTGE
jgi:hypothetical protein